MHVTLIVTEGPNRGMAFTFADHDTFLVGRSLEAHFVMPEKDPYFSRFHFLVEVNPPLCRLVDLNSRNGTYVNGQSVESADLRDGDRIKAGHTTIVVELQDTALRPPTAVAESFADLLARVKPLAAAQLADCLRDDQRQRWTRGDRVLVESYLQQLPDLEGESEAVLDLIYHEVLLREERGESPQLDEYRRRFPRHAEAVRRQFEVHEAVKSGSALAKSAAAPTRPRPAPTLDDSQQTQPSPETVTPIGLGSQDQGGRPRVPGHEIVRELGRGAMGVVYQARRPDGTSVALKTILPTVRPTPDAVSRFLREANILRLLDHPNIVAFRDLGEADGLLYFVMDFVDGKDAGAITRAEGPLPMGRAVAWTCQLLEALTYAHGRGFVHRDIKPANVLVTSVQGNETVKLADFGLARTYQASRLSGLTMTGGSGGTPAFMPPEQVMDFRRVQPTADQYAAAATLYWLLTGQPLYDGVTSVLDLLSRITQADPVPIQTRRPELPAGLAAAIGRALSRKPPDRFADAAAFRLALLSFVGV